MTKYFLLNISTHYYIIMDNLLTEIINQCQFKCIIIIIIILVSRLVLGPTC